MHITITGNLGSGKSTVCKILQDKYGYEIYSTGKVQRKLAKELNMTTLEFNKQMCNDHRYDNMIDEATARISRENKDKKIIFDSRLAWNFVEKSFKIFLSVPIDIAAQRVMNDKKRGEVESYSSLEEAKAQLSQRATTEKARYKDIYNLDYFDFNNYNLIIDSSYNDPEKIAEIIINEAYNYNESPYDNTKYLLSPQRLINKDDISKNDVIRLENIIYQYKGKKIVSHGIKIIEQNNDFTILEGEDNIKAANIANVDYIKIEG
ncbi:MAG TPA: dephospho-CoA kinase [Clostridiales bacterium]|nr:dephospho-CoA kinase [Clostridiales bacterium]